MGILKAGGAYVPLDPDYPQERLQFMLQDANCQLVLTQEKIKQALHFLGENNKRSIICLDRELKKHRRNKMIDSLMKIS